jgi:pilus assembly protein Flp/PilA
MINSVRIFFINELGATAIEYSLIASLVALAILAAVSQLGGQLQNSFNEVASNLK